MANKVVIIGGGASGVMAALSVARESSNRVFLLERQDKLLRKVRVAGNGRCNISNVHLSDEFYFSVASSEKQKAKILSTVLHQFSVQDSLRFFQELGLFFREDDAGRVYPYAEQSDVFVDLLEEAVVRSGVTICLNAEVKGLWAEADRIKINVDQLSTAASTDRHLEHLIMDCDDLILACGSQASSNLGGSHSGYDLLRQLDVEISDLYPALVPLILKESKTQRKVLSGQRFKGTGTLIRDGQVIFVSKGEFLFTEQGLSGIAAMELARFIQNPAAHKYEVALDFIPDLSFEELVEFRSNYKLKSMSLAEAFVKKQIALYLTKHNKKDQDMARLLKDCRFGIEGTAGSVKAQVMAGGALLNQIHFPQFCLKKNPHVYLCGELLDIDGATGGFNLQWAWSSGYLAGRGNKPY